MARILPAGPASSLRLAAPDEGRAAADSERTPGCGLDEVGGVLAGSVGSEAHGDQLDNRRAARGAALVEALLRLLGGELVAAPAQEEVEPHLHEPGLLEEPDQV